jgi:hypothetical protein
MYRLKKVLPNTDGPEIRVQCVEETEAESIKIDKISL